MKTYIIILFMGFWVVNSYAQTPQKISYVYDDLSRLSSVTYPNGTQVVYTYDALGNRQTLVITNGACTPPTAPTVPSATINSGQTASLTASGCSGTVKWYNQQTNGTLLFTGNPYTTSALTTTTTYYASCTVNNCESSTGSGTVTISGGCTPPAVPNVPATSIGMATSVTLNYTNACVGGTIKWYDAQTSGNLLNTGGIYTTPTIYATTYYYISCTVNSCESPRGQLTINYTPLPCVGNQNSSGNYGTTNIQTNGTITTTATILSGARTNFFAGQSVTLNPGFKTSSGTVFRAEIQACVSNNGLIAYYPFNGNANDESGNLNHGIVNGASLGTDRFGNTNKAYRFTDGNFIRVPNSGSLSLPNAFTISIWANMQSATGRDGNGSLVPYGNHTMIAKSCDMGTLSWAISPQPNGTFVSNVWAGNNGDYPTIPFQINTWRYLTITYDGIVLKQFVNGNLISSKAVSNNFIATNASDLYIGKMGCWSYFFNGFLDDIRIYNRALTAQEVQSIYAIER